MYLLELFIGMLCGVVLSLLFSFGPAFFGLIQSSVQHGFRRASAFVIGVSLSDLLVVGLMLTVLKNVDMEAVVRNEYVASIAGAAIIAMGVYIYNKRAKAVQGKHGRLKFKADETRMRYLALHGFLLNIFNPFIWVYWISVVALLSGELELSGVARIVFFGGLLAATLGCDLLKCRLASLLQTWITAEILNITNKVMGVLMMAFGVYLIVSMVIHQRHPDEGEVAPQPVKVIQQVHSRIVKDSAKRNDTVYLK